MLGPDLRPPLLPFIHSQDVFCLLQSLFCSVLVVEGVFGDFWAPSCGTLQRPTAPFFLEKAPWVLWCWGCFEPTYTTFCFLGSHPDIAEGLGCKSQLDYTSGVCSAPSPAPGFCNGLLCSPGVCCSDCSRQTLLSLSSREQMPQEGMKTLLGKAKNDCVHRDTWSIYY